MSEMQLPKDHPAILAFERYKASDEFHNTFKWATYAEHRTGSMWAAFYEGFQAALSASPPMTDSAEKMREAIKRFYRNGCYHEALDFEVDALVNELAALSASGTKSDGGVESRHAKTGNMSGAVPEEEQSLPASGFVRAFGPEDKTSKPRDGVAPIPSDPTPDERPVCKLCGLEDGACICRSIPKQPQPDEVEAIARLLTAAKLLQQNAVGCAIYHHGHDCEMSGLPGWLADTKKDIDAAEDAILAMLAERRGDPERAPIAPLTEGPFFKGGHNLFPSQIKDRPAAPAPINKPPAQPAPIAGLEPVAWRFTKLSVWHVTSERNWAEAHGDCVEPLYTRAQLEAHAAEQVRPLVEALEGLIEAVELDADEGLEGIGSYTGARLTDAKNAIRARGQV